MRKIKVAVMMGGFSSEHEVSLKSGEEVIKNLDKNKYEVDSLVLPNNEGGINLINKEWCDKVKPDVVFIAMHGRFGEDGKIQKILEDLKIKYIGCGPDASEIGINKIVFKKLMERYGLLTPNWTVLEKEEGVDLREILKLGEKLVVKPSDQGSSVGVSIVKRKSELKKALDKAFEYGDTIIVEEHIEGIEVSCGAIGNKEVEVLPIVEICPKNDFFDYEAKYSEEKCEEIVPARLNQEMTDKVEELTNEIYRVVGCRGFARVDYIIRNNVPYVLEINTIPGLTPNSLLPKEAKAAGIEYSNLLDRVITLALE